MKFLKLFNILLIGVALNSQAWGSYSDEPSSQRVCYASPMNGLAFAKLMTVESGDEESKMEIVSLLRSLSGDADITGVEVLEKESPTLPLRKKRTDGKWGFMDCKCRTSDGRHYIIEVQIGQEDHWDKRALFYAATMYTNSLPAGKEYSELKDVTGINILGFRSTPELPSGSYKRDYRLRDEENPELEHYIKSIRIIQYEIPKVTDEVIRTLGETSELASWLTLFRLNPGISHEELPTLHTTVARAANKRLKVNDWSDEERQEYTDSLAGMRQQRSDVQRATDEATLRTAISSALSMLEFVDASKLAPALEKSLKETLGEEAAIPVIGAMLTIINGDQVNTLENVLSQLETDSVSSRESSHDDNVSNDNYKFLLATIKIAG